MLRGPNRVAEVQFSMSDFSAFRLHQVMSAAMRSAMSVMCKILVRR